MSAERELATALGRNQSFAWAGRPATGIKFRAADVLLVPFSAMWFGFAIFWEAAVVTSEAPFFFKLWGVPFLLMGLFIFAGRFFVDAYLRAHTVYGIGEGKAYILRTGLLPRITTYDLRATAPIEMSAKGDGSGTITFGRKPWSAWSGWSVWLDAGQDFRYIPNVAQVYRLVTSASA